jgi:hypothetical protein
MRSGREAKNPKKSAKQTQKPDTTPRFNLSPSRPDSAEKK